MEELKLKLEDFLEKININTIFLLKILLILFLINVFLIFINIFYNTKLYFEIKDKVNQDKILIVDNNGNQYFKRIGYMNEDLIVDFSIVSMKNIFEYNYENTFNLDYAKKYFEESLYHKYEKKYLKEKEQLILEEGFYKVNFLKINFTNINEREEYWELKAIIEKKYNGIGVKEIKKLKEVKLRVDYKHNVFTNTLGLIITKLQEREMSEEEIAKMQENKEI